MQIQKIQQQTEVATKKNHEIESVNEALRKELREGDHMMEKYTTEISKIQMTKQANTPTRSVNSKRSSQLAMRRLKQWSGSLTRTSSLRTPSRTTSFWSVSMRMLKKQKRRDNSSTTITHCSTVRRRSLLKVIDNRCSYQQQHHETKGTGITVTSAKRVR